MTEQRQYLLPANVEPDDDVCIRVYVPNETEYIAAFFGALEYFGKWLAWERDEAHNASLAAHRWQQSIERTQEEWECAKGECGIMDVRVKPDFPCTLQKQTGCDGEWVDWADITDCTQAVPAPLDTDPVDLADDALWALKETFLLIHSGLSGGQSASQLKYQLAGLGIPGINQTIDDMAAMTEAARQSALDNMDWESMRDAIWCRRVECHMESYTLPGNIEGWVTCFLRNLETWSAETAGSIADWAAELINGVIPASFMNLVNMFPFEGAGFGFAGPSCLETIEYDFTLGSELGWSKYTANSTYWNGAGWSDGYPTMSEDGVSINSPVLPAIRIRRVELLLDMVMVGNNPSAALFRYITSWGQWQRISDDRQLYVFDGLDWQTNGTTHRINVNIDEWFGGPNNHTDASIIKVVVYHDPL